MNRKYIILIIIVFCLVIYYAYICVRVLVREEQEKITIQKLIFDENEEDEFDWSDEYISDWNNEYQRDKKEKYPLLNQNDSSQYITDVDASTSEQKDYRNYDCILSIPKIDLMKYVYSGKNRMKRLENYELITASEDMYYKNGGNYIICGHASQLYGHSFNRLNELNIGDIVYVWYNESREEYIIKSITYNNMNYSNEYCNQTQKNELTILSCAKHVGPNEYIIIKCMKQ